MQAPAPMAPAAASPYQPPASGMLKGNIYAFQKWLMIGLALLVFSAAFGELPFTSSMPDMADYDMTDTKEAEEYADDVDSYMFQISFFGAISAVLQTGALTMLSYAFVREAQEEQGQHVGMRIAFMLAAVVLITSIVGRGFSLF
jgi:hypothetical protein